MPQCYYILIFLFTKSLRFDFLKPDLGKVLVRKNCLAEAPKFVEPKTEQHPEDGTTAEIECKVDAEPGVEIFWQFNGDTLGECECFVIFICHLPFFTPCPLNATLSIEG